MNWEEIVKIVTELYPKRQVTFNEDQRTIRFDYWESVDTMPLKERGIIVMRNLYEDDDCGWLYSYHVVI